MERIRKKRSIIITCVIVCVCLAGAAAVAATVIRRRNPLEKGLMNLALEVMALEEETGEGFWTDAANRIGSGNAWAEYSVNIGGIPGTQNITVGFDGAVKRDMEQGFFEADLAASVANAELGEVLIFGTEDELYVQVPSIWDGSVVFDADNVSGQWDGSQARAQLQKLTGEELGIGQRIDARFLREFSVKEASVSGFLRENAGGLRKLYENMEVIKLEKAQDLGLLSGEQVEELAGVEMTDAEGNQKEIVCYLTVLPEEELKEIAGDTAGEIRLGVYLDREERIVRVCSVPGERVVTKYGDVTFALSLAGEDSTVDKVEAEFCFAGERGKIFSALRDKAVKMRDEMAQTGEERAVDSENEPSADLAKETKEHERREPSALSDDMELDCSFVIERDREKAGGRCIEGECRIDLGKSVWEISAEGVLRGERTDAGEKVFVDLERSTFKLQNEVICRVSGEAVVMPLGETIGMPAGEEYRIGEMNEMETVGFLAGCVENVYRNYAGYLKLLE